MESTEAAGDINSTDDIITADAAPTDATTATEGDAAEAAADADVTDITDTDVTPDSSIPASGGLDSSPSVEVEDGCAPTEGFSTFKKSSSLNRSGKFRRLIRRGKKDGDRQSGDHDNDSDSSLTHERIVIGGGGSGSKRDSGSMYDGDSGVEDGGSGGETLPGTPLIRSHSEPFGLTQRGVTVRQQSSHNMEEDAERGKLLPKEEDSEDEEAGPEKPLDLLGNTVMSLGMLVIGFILHTARWTYTSILNVFTRFRYWVTGTVPEPVDEAVIAEAEPEPPAVERKKSVEPVLNKRVFHICNELMTTEEAYVERLGLLVMAKEKATKIFGMELARDMFKDVQVIHQFHRDNLLPQLQERMDEWDKFHKIGDIMRKLTPFLKLYTDYVKDFQKSSNLVDNYEAKSSAFASALKDIQENQGQRNNLPVQAHMMEPVQRVPRYKLLLQDYLKRIPEDSPDRSDAAKALESVSEAAEHFENMMKRDSRIARLMSVQQRIEGNVNVVLPSRELIKEARILRISANSGKPSSKYAFLFNDVMMICNKQTLVGKTLKVRHTVNLKEFESLEESRNLEVPYTFSLKCGEEELELCTHSSEEMQSWISALTSTLSSLMNRDIRYPGPFDLATIVAEEHTAVLEGHLHLSLDEGKSWKKRYFTLHKSGLLISGKSMTASQRFSSDCAALTSINTLQFSKTLSENTSKKGRTMMLTSQGRTYYLSDESEEQIQRWHRAMLDMSGEDDESMC